MVHLFQRFRVSSITTYGTETRISCCFSRRGDSSSKHQFPNFLVELVPVVMVGRGHLWSGVHGALGCREQEDLLSGYLEVPQGTGIFSPIPKIPPLAITR